MSSDYFLRFKQFICCVAIAKANIIIASTGNCENIKLKHKNMKEIDAVRFFSTSSEILILMYRKNIANSKAIKEDNNIPKTVKIIDELLISIAIFS